jgi:predicted PurR-regulated permease PerM
VPAKPPAPPPSPIEPRSDRSRTTVETALIWIASAAAVWLAWQLAQALLLIFAGIVVAAGLRSAEDLLRRAVNLPHAVRLTIIVVVLVGLILGFLAFAGVALAAQAQQLSSTVDAQLARLTEMARGLGLNIEAGHSIPARLQSLLDGNFDRVAAFVGSAIGGMGALLFAFVFGIYVAADPRLYERGLEWLTPMAARGEMHATLAEMGTVLRRWVAGRLLTMGIEGGFIFIGLSIVGVPLAGLLGLVSGLLAFIPNLGAMISGALIVAVGFSVGPTEGLWAVGIYLAVQLIEGNVLTPLIEKRAVDLAPAVVLAAQLLFGILFGVLGVALADPIVALAKVALVRRSKPAGTDPAP